MKVSKIIGLVLFLGNACQHVDAMEQKTSVDDLIDALCEARKKETSADAYRRWQTLLKAEQAVAQLAHRNKQEFIKALRSGNLDDVKRLIKAPGVDVNKTTFNDQTPLMLAAEEGTAEVVKFLLETGADPKLEIPGRTALLNAVAKPNNIETVRLLIAAGANVNARNQYGSTPLIQAANQGSTEIAKMLIDAHADVNIAGAHSKTALHQAIGFKNMELAKYLLEHGADPVIEGGTETPLALAKRVGEAMEKLIQEHINSAK